MHEDVMEHAVAYLLKKNKSISRVDVKEIIYLADIHHLLMHGVTITKSLLPNSYELSAMSIKNAMDKRDKLLTFKAHESILSFSNKDSLEFALVRYNSELGALPDRIKVKINY